jgi:hypothetical protein
LPTRAICPAHSMPNRTCTPGSGAAQGVALR